jgi:hypothetical protein
VAYVLKDEQGRALLRQTIDYVQADDAVQQNWGRLETLHKRAVPKSRREKGASYQRPPADIIRGATDKIEQSQADQNREKKAIMKRARIQGGGLVAVSVFLSLVEEAAGEGWIADVIDVLQNASGGGAVYVTARAGLELWERTAAEQFCAGLLQQANALEKAETLQWSTDDLIREYFDPANTLNRELDKVLTSSQYDELATTDEATLRQYASALVDDVSYCIEYCEAELKKPLRIERSINGPDSGVDKTTDALPLLGTKPTEAPSKKPGDFFNEVRDLFNHDKPQRPEIEGPDGPDGPESDGGGYPRHLF